MNYRMIGYMVGRMMLIGAALMVLPLIVGLIEGDGTLAAFLIPATAMGAAGGAMSARRPKRDTLYAKEGMLVVAVVWLVMSAFGALPFVISGQITSYVDALFETVSGFTTTGATVLLDIEALSRSMAFWRSFTHWIGGMGVLVFALAVLPKHENHSIHLLRAEAPGPMVGKLVARMHVTARILYGIYVLMTLILVVLLMAGGMSFYDSLLHAFSTAGTGGFSNYTASVAQFDSVYIETVISVFMLLFGVNFNLFYLILLGKVREVFQSEELRWFVAIVAVASVIIALDIVHMYGSFAESIRHAFFSVSSIITTTGFVTQDFGRWPEFSQYLLLLLMLCGACAGSTGGGLKVSRVIMVFKIVANEFRRVLHPRSVTSVKLEGKAVDKNVVSGLHSYLVLYITMMVASMLVLALFEEDFTTVVTGVITCFNNVGPGLGEIIGPSGSFAALSDPAKLVLCFDMLAGRLEIYPMLTFLLPGLWRK